MAEKRSGLSNLGDVIGGLAAAGTMAAGTAVITDGVHNLEAASNKPVAPQVAMADPAEDAKNNAKKELAAGVAGVVIGTGGLAALLASRREQPFTSSNLPNSWGNNLNAGSTSTTAQPPRDQSWTGRNKGNGNDPDKGSQSERS